MTFEYVLLKDSDVFTKSDQYIAIFSGENPQMVNSVGIPGKEGFGVGFAPQEMLTALHLKELPGTHDRTSFQYGLYEYEQPADDVKHVDETGKVTINGVVLEDSVTDSAQDSQIMLQNDSEGESSKVGNPGEIGGYDDGSEEDNESVPIKPVTPNKAFTSTQSYRAFFKYIPRFYVKLLSRSDEVLMTEEELQEIQPYTAVTVEQMIEAQNKAGTAALVITKPGAFRSKDEAALHGFTYLDAFIDGGKEVDGFFIQNTLPMYYTSTDGTNLDTIYYFGHPDFKFEPKCLYENKRSGIVRCDATSPKKEFGLSPNQRLPESVVKKFPGTNLETVHMRAVLRVLEFAEMLYGAPSWLTDSNKSVMGINSNGSTDINDQTIVANTSVSTDTGDVWTQDAEMYLKTTHNGQINGITNLNGWVYQMVLGADSSWQRVMNRDRKLSEVTLDDVLADGGVAAPQQDADAVWGHGKLNQPWYRGDPHLFGVVPSQGTCTTNPTDLFGDDTFRHISGYPIAAVGRCFKDGQNAGIFAALYGSNYEYTSSLTSFRLAMYPEGNDTVISLIPDLQGGIGSSVVEVAKETIWKDAKALIAEPTFDGHKFKHWSLSVNGDEIKDDHVFSANTVISAVWQ